jgi:anti-sigma B factor antagonist
VPLLQTRSIRLDDGSVALVLVGELDGYSSPAVTETITALAGEGVARVEVDLAGVSFVDSSGLAALIGATKRLRAAGGDLVIHRPQLPTRRVFEMTGLHNLFTVVAEAVPA